MILFLIFIGILIISITVAIISFKNDSWIWNSFKEAIGTISVIIALFTGLAVLASAIIIGCENNPSLQEKHKQEWAIKREAIIWQMENGYMSGDLAEYNEKIYSMQWMHINPWTNWYQGEYAMDLEMINLNDYER